jgi:ABC-type lipoprotein release transport system permease subunit
VVPLKYNVRNLVARWWVTLLIGIGFMLIVLVLTVMLAFVTGLGELSKKCGPEGNVIVLTDGANDEMFSQMEVNDAESNISTSWSQNTEVLWDKDKGIPLVSREVYCLAAQELPPQEPGGRTEYRFLQMRGVEDSALAGRIHGLRLKPGGRWFPPEGGTGREVVMGEGIAHTMGLAVGDTFEPKPGLVWTVVGLLDSRGAPFDSEIWGKRTEIGSLFGKDNEEKKTRYYTSIVAATKDRASAESLAAKIKDSARVKANAMPERQYYEALSRSTELFTGAALFIALIMAVGGMFGLMNAMFAAVSARIKDIGVLRILGYSRPQILLSFLLESLLLAVVGGGLGLLLGYAANGVEQKGVMSAGQGGAGKLVVFTMLVTPRVLVWGVGFTLGMGLLGGLLPALSAMRLKVLDAVR